MKLIDSRSINWIVAILGVVSIGLVCGMPGSALAATNQATGDIGGDPTDLQPSNVVTINSSVLGLVKAAFLTDGTELPADATLPAGTDVQFLIYVDNDTDIQIDDINIVDDLTSGDFVYESPTLKIDNSEATGATLTEIYDAIVLTGTIDDTVELGDEAGVAAAVVSAGSTAGNLQLDVPANTVWAMLFTVEVQ